MKIIILPLAFFILNLRLATAQEVTIDVSILAILIDQDELNKMLIAQSNEMQLEIGQWTNIDRENNLSRFEAAMNFIVFNNRTDLLSDLIQISAYYEYLNNQVIVKKSGIKWQREASEVTLALQAIPIGLVIGYVTSIIYTKLAENSKLEDKSVTKLKKMLEEGISPAGLDFMDGTASKRIAADVTHNFYCPLFTGKLKVVDAFEYDAKLLYREQFDILQTSYYSKFNDFDNELIVGWSAKLYAMAKLDIKNPRNRLLLGLRRMDYSEEQILNYISILK